MPNENISGGMATTSLSLGEHWEVFIRNEISSVRYGSASEMARSALRVLEEREAKLAALRTICHCPYWSVVTP